MSFLDPRPSSEADAEPYANSVNIPAEDIAARVAELPRKDEVIRVIGPTAYRLQALEVLRDLGREAILVPCESLSSTNQDSKIKHQKFMGRLWRPNEFLEESALAMKPGTALDLACGTGRDAVYLASLSWDVTGVDILPDAVERAATLASRYCLPKNCAADHDRKYGPAECGSLLPVKIRQLAAGVDDRAGSKLPQTEQEQAPALHSFAGPLENRESATQSKPNNRNPTFVTLDLSRNLPGIAFDLVTCFFYFDPKLLAKLHTLLNPGCIALIELFTDEDKAKHGKPKKTVNPADLGQLLVGLQINKQDEGWHHGRHTVRVAASVR
ncbi:MAG TPA: methyltransferase domain-containing protein [Fimbriimonadaceae bacterium]